MSTTSHDEGERQELLREASTMALYVSVTLLATLIALDERADHGQVRALAVVWGTTLGLALTHWFAFRLSAQLVGHGRVSGRDTAVSAAQLVGAAVVAVLATIPVVLLPTTAENDTVRALLATLIGGFGFAVARSSGASRRRAGGYAVGVLVLAMTVAVAKNGLSGH